MIPQLMHIKQLELRAIDPNTSFSYSPGDDYWKPFISRQMLSIIN